MQGKKNCETNICIRKNVDKKSADEKMSYYAITFGDVLKAVRVSKCLLFIRL